MSDRPLDIEGLVAEVANSNFEDERLNRRLKMLIQGLAKDPTLSLPSSFDSAGLEAAYRFFSNVRVTPEAILSAHFEQTRKRCAAEGDFLVAHDTTTFSYRFDGERKGLGPVQGLSSVQAFFAHVSLAMSADGTRRPLGIAAFKTWTRGLKRSGLEHERWEQQVRAASQQLDARKHAIHLADREADDYEMFCGLQRDQYRFVVRCQFNRRVSEPSGAQRLHELFAGMPSTVEREVPLSRRKPHRKEIARKLYPAREARVATLSVTAAAVTFKRPASQSKELPESLTINVVRVWEPNPVDGAPVEWLLYTSEPIDTVEQQLAVVDYYRARWVIEEYFKAIKTGCAFESRQLQDYEALVNLLATFASIAYRLLLIRSEAERAPEQSAVSLLPTDHLDALRTCGRVKLPPQPTARDVYLAIAALGGHIKYSGDPGWLTLARGYEKLELIAQGWVAAKLQPPSDQR